MTSSSFLNPSNAEIVFCCDEIVHSEKEWLIKTKSLAMSLADDCEIPFSEFAVNSTVHSSLLNSSALSLLTRRALVLVGGTLEFAVTQVALRAMLEGFDVFVIADLVFAQRLRDRAILLDRLRFRGIDILTIRQAKLELTIFPVDLTRI